MIDASPASEAGGQEKRAAFFVDRKLTPGVGLVDRFFFLAAGLAGLGMGIALVVHGLRLGWGYIAILVLLWGFMAYLALPRLHRILSGVYVPNYFIGRTRTSDGLLGDPVNVALMGDEAQIHHAMREAGWTRADEITAASAWRIVASTLGGRSYPEAPVSPLFLFGRRQDFAYQQEVDGNPGKRHHVRFWRCPDGWLLPGGRRVDWLAAGTYDRAVGFSLFTLQITHKIDENTDIERDYIVRTVSEASPRVRVEILADFSSGYHSRNGGGDSIVTDGDLPVLDLRELDARAHEHELVARSTAALDATATETGFGAKGLNEELWSRRPLPLLLGVLLILADLILGLIRLPLQTAQALASEATGDETVRSAVLLVVIVLTSVLLVAQLVLLLLFLRGGRIARHILMSLLLLNITVMLLSSFGEGAGTVLLNLLSLVLQISALMALSGSASRDYARAHAVRRLRGRRAPDSAVEGSEGRA